ncbi:MAG TPA: UDP-2,3-diacylglucosamine diphosphatase [Steroidobacteraceae bacterium]|nr:UDP-2,3-diacylglucosamine diphosphatase [Steroidobacteraceae bacterium]
MARLFVSDLHLDAASPQAIEQFLEFLASEASRADALYILGDLFEAWIGDDDPEPTRARICDALRRLTSGGVACFVLHGNRDFLLSEGFSRRTGCILLPDPVIAEFDGERVLLTHGDALCTGDRAYQELRSTVRNAHWQQRFLALPLAVRARLAERARAGSRAHTSRVVPNIMDVDPAAVAVAHRATGARRIIHGHTHRPGIHESTLDGAPAYRIVLGAWYEQGSVLIADSGRYELRELPRS